MRDRSACGGSGGGRRDGGTAGSRPVPDTDADRARQQALLAYAASEMVQHGYTPRRSAGLAAYENVLARAGLAPVAGIDEAGRGACAGPLVVALSLIHI